MNLLKKHIAAITVSILSAVVSVACGIVPFFCVAKIITLITENNHDINSFASLIVLVFAGLFGALIFYLISTVLSHTIAYGVIADARKTVIEKLVAISMGQVEKKSSGQWVQFVVETLDKLERPIAHMIPEVIANILIPVAMVIVVFVMDWRVGLANIASLPLGVLFSMLMMNGYEERFNKYQQAAKNMNTAAVEYIQGINVIKAFNRSASSYGKFKKAVNENRDAMLDWFFSVSFYITAAMEIIPASLLFVLPVSLFLFAKGTLTSGILVMCVLLSYASYKPLIKAMSFMDIMANVKVIIREIQSVMCIPEMQRGSQRQKVLSHQVTFEHVKFGYDKAPIFSDLNFTAEEKKLTAIVGHSGSGKSTIARLIAGFWNVTDGAVKIGGVSLRDMPLEQNMELVTFVSQENFLFNKSIAENMRMAKANATDIEIEEACKKASCHEFIAALPEGYNTNAGEAGTHFSGGERQRLTIARALLKDSPIVVLDEATAYSDPDNEALIQQSINALLKEKTVIMIAHRLSTIIHADKIIVLNNGTVDAQGTHSELLKTSSVYREQWEAHERVRNIL